MTEPFFSIIVPVYNVEKYLDECIMSVLNQSFSDYEVLLIDDGSTDSCASICDSYADKYPNKIRVIHQKNKGLGGARNTGLSEASGKWVLFVDSDDCLAALALEKWHEALYDCHEIMVSARYERMDENGCVLEHDALVMPSFASGEIDASDYKSAIIFYNERAGWAVWKNAYRREFIIENDLFFYEPVRVSEDVYWMLKLIKRLKRLVFADITVYLYRVNRQGGLDSNVMGRLNGCIITFERLLEEKKAQPLDEDDKTAFSFIADLFMADVIRTARLGDKSEIRTELIGEGKELLVFLSSRFSSVKRMLLAAFLKIFGLRAFDRAVRSLK